MQIAEPGFSLTLPGGNWTNHSTSETLDFQSGEHEQVLVTRHLPRAVLTEDELQKSVADLFKLRLKSLEQMTGNARQFEPPTSETSHGRMRMLAFGYDPRKPVFMQVGVFGIPTKIIAISYYKHAGSSDRDEFKRRANELFSSVKLGKL
jgi:hypothetical protein